MSKYKEIVKESTIAHKVHIRCLIPVPDVYFDETLASAMGRDVSEKNENLEKFVEEILAPQYFRQMKNCIKVFEKSAFPIRLLEGQQIRLETLGFDMPLVYDCLADVIIEDLDSTITPKRDYLFGYGIGNKVLNLKRKSEVNRAIEEVCSIAGISNREALIGLLCCEAGNIVSESFFDNNILENLSEIKLEGIRKVMLRLAWSV